MTKNWDRTNLRAAMFAILAKYHQEDVKKFGKILGDDLLDTFFREAFEAGWHAQIERSRESARALNKPCVDCPKYKEQEGVNFCPTCGLRVKGH